MHNNKTVRIIEEAYKFADKDKKGYLTKRELNICFLATFGFKPSKFEVGDILERHGEVYKTNNVFENEIIVGVPKEKITAVMAARHTAVVDKDDGIRELFQSFDTRCKGFIDIEDFKKAVRLKFKHLNEMTILQYFREVDSNCDGRVSYSDFHYMMSNVQDGL